MVRHILLKLDEKMFNKLKKDKLSLEADINCQMSWEDYIKYLFGFQSDGR